MPNPKTPGNEPDPGTTDPTEDCPGKPNGDVEPIADDGEPLGDNFA